MNPIIFFPRPWPKTRCFDWLNSRFPGWGRWSLAGQKCKPWGHNWHAARVLVGKDWDDFCAAVKYVREQR